MQHVLIYLCNDSDPKLYNIFCRYHCQAMTYMTFFVSKIIFFLFLCEGYIFSFSELRILVACFPMSLQVFPTVLLLKKSYLLHVV